MTTFKIKPEPCPECETGELALDISTGQLECVDCGKVFTLEETVEILQDRVGEKWGAK